MVIAILGGKKSQTRRLVPEWQKPKLTHDGSQFMSTAQRHPRWGFGLFGSTEEECMNEYNEHRSLCPFGKKGDVLWVRETTEEDCRGSVSLSKYSADGAPVLLSNCEDPNFNGSVAHWDYSRPTRPSIHMQRKASRLSLRIINTRVERLCDISEQDAIAEGCDNSKSKAAIEAGWYEKPRRAFRRLWESINGRGTWEDNPWVWVVEFERIN